MFSTIIFKVLFVGYVLTTVAVAAEKNTNKLSVTVFYESLCPDCSDFFTDQLQPSMRIKNRLPYTDLKLVPYGKATLTIDDFGMPDVKCQHGPVECKENALEACVLENAAFDKAFDVIACYQSETGNFLQCANRYHLDLIPIAQCQLNRDTGSILEKYANETIPFDLKFVPAIAIDNILDANQQDDLISQFDGTFCKLYAEKFGQHLDDCPGTMKPITLRSFN